MSEYKVTAATGLREWYEAEDLNDAMAQAATMVLDSAACGSAGLEAGDTLRIQYTITTADGEIAYGDLIEIEMV